MSGRLRFCASYLLVLFLPAVALTACVPGAAVKQSNQSLIRDRFPDGKPELEWAPYPYFNQDNLRGELDPSSPTGEPGVGVLDNKNAGGFAALSYAKAQPIGDFHLETWIYVQVVKEEKGSLNGIAFRVDPVQDKFYRVSAHFTANPSLSLAYVGRDTKHFPVYLAEWKDAAIPGGTPKQGGWHRLAIEVNNNDAEVFWDGAKLPGGPFRLERSASGYIGVYATFTGGLGIAETRIAGLEVSIK